ncbi:MAG: FprA family A-type flavoprotein [Oligoflexia bacterium]|nr:FprA family A-type flavoprotein [Oligoflexia bacterium]MBF0366527.1 FprA family A-type flavoprotein [Oligoflexia bacterium]
MQAREIKPGIYWVGGIDWNLRNFHGYSTDKGSTYNAYLIVDEKIALIDTVKANLTQELISRIRKVVDPARIDYVISNHIEMDHSGALPAIMELTPHATLVTSPNGDKGLHAHYPKEACRWKFKVVQQGDTISLGKRTLQFLPIPMVHWPDSMLTYVPEEKLLMPNDAFGQHLASEFLFDDEIGCSIVREQAAKYYANIVLPYSKSVQTLLTQIQKMKIEFDMIAPSHGVVIRKNVKELVSLYNKWSTHQSDNKVLILYDTMWNSTEKMAETIQLAVEEMNIPCCRTSLTTTHISDVITRVMESRYIFIGSPTLNNQVLPTMASMLSYMQGLRPRNKIGFVFGSYGWGGQAPKLIEESLRALGWELPLPPMAIKYIPTEESLDELRTQVTKILTGAK